MHSHLLKKEASKGQAILLIAFGKRQSSVSSLLRNVLEDVREDEAHGLKIRLEDL